MVFFSNASNSNNSNFKTPKKSLNPKNKLSWKKQHYFSKFSKKWNSYLKEPYTFNKRWKFHSNIMKNKKVMAKSKFAKTQKVPPKIQKLFFKFGVSPTDVLFDADSNGGKTKSLWLTVPEISLFVTLAQQDFHRMYRATPAADWKLYRVCRFRRRLGVGVFWVRS